MRSQSCCNPFYCFWAKVVFFGNICKLFGRKNGAYGLIWAVLAYYISAYTSTTKDPLRDVINPDIIDGIAAGKIT